MAKCKLQMEFMLLSAPLSDFNYKLSALVNQGWKPVPRTPVTIEQIQTEFNRESWAYQMLVRTYDIEKEVS